MSDDQKTEGGAIQGKWPILDILLRSDATSRDDAAAEKARRKAEYDALNRKLNRVRIGKYSHFLNYGYVADGTPSFARFTPPETHIDAASRRLVLEVLGDYPVNGADVIDVSCGRGAVAVTLRDYFAPKSYLGIDLSPEAVAFCRAQHGRTNVMFEEGDAEALPVPDASADVVTNVEASHNYPAPDAFFGEVARVLRPGGWFLYTDFLPPASFAQNVARLEAKRFEKLRDVNITANVIRASDGIAAMRVRAYDDPEEQRYMADFLAVPGSETYRAFQDGRLQYRMYAFRLQGRS
jgi:phthiocerol/phenolphthiocerol synthesis type-I polyketide synthase E